MPNKWQYPRWRRATMQAVMWVVFGATLAAAALVSRRRDVSSSLPLAEPRVVGAVSVRLPVGWEVTPDDQNDPSVLLRATEQTEEEGALSRVLIVRTTRVPYVMPARQFLARAGLPLYLSDSNAPGVGRDGELTVTMAGRPGVITGGQTQRALVRGPDGQLAQLDHRLYFATVVLPSRVAVWVSIEGLGHVDGADLAVLRRVAGALELNDGTAPTDGATTASASPLVLPGGVKVPVPPKFVAIDEPGSNRPSRTFIGMNDSSSIELIPCLLTGADTDADRVTLAEMREPYFHGGQIVALPNVERQWEIRPPNGAPAPMFPVRAFLASDTSGSALLAIFRTDRPAKGDLSGPMASFDEPWRVIAGGLSFESRPTGVDKLVESGERATSALAAPPAGAATVLAAQRGTRWALWYRDGDNRAVGWSSETIGSAPNGWSGTRRSRWRDGAAINAFADAWTVDPNLTTYARTTATDGMLDRPGVIPRQSFILKDAGVAAITTVPGRESKMRRAAPKNFIPFPVLVAAMGKLPADEAMILKTDSFPGLEPGMKFGLLSVLIEPDDEIRAADDGSGPLRCLKATVNGTGDSSRWFFHQDGRLAQVDLSDGMHRKPADASDITEAFSGDVKMTP